MFFTALQLINELLLIFPGLLVVSLTGTVAKETSVPFNYFKRTMFRNVCFSNVSVYSVAVKASDAGHEFR
jgi:hypothetical protein